MWNLTNLLVIWLLVFPGTSTLQAEPGSDAMRLVGTWELVGVGDQTGNVTTPARLVISFLASGECYVRSWEHDTPQPDTTHCEFDLTDGVLSLTPRTSGPPDLLEVEWDAWILVLKPLDDIEPPPLPLRFEKRPWAESPEA